LAALCTLFASAPASAQEAPERKLAPPDRAYTWTSPALRPTLAWTLTQLVPSPEVGIGSVRSVDANGVDEGAKTKAAFGLRWQITPILWSWGVHRRLDRWRFLVVDPLARNAGSIGFDAKVEYLFGHVGRVLFRPGIHTTLPLVQRGEYMSASLGTSIYQYDDTMRVSYDAGLYFLYGVLGAEISYAPTHAPLRTVATLRIRYF
jgi:hypothetical protein